MKDVFLVYDRCCFYEIVILSYFLNYSHCDLVFCSPDGKPVRAMEGFSVHVDASLEDLDKAQIRSFIVPGGAVSGIDTAEVKVLLRDLKQRGALIAGICAGVDVLDHAGILHDVKSTHASDDDWVCDKQVATARANALEEPTMKNFMNMHPVLADVCDTVLTLLSGGFALLAVGIVWLKEFLTGRSST